MIDGQMELSFGGARERRAVNRRQQRLGRATWWFARMRQTVEQAIDWEPAPPPRPEQTWFPNAHRQVGAVSSPPRPAAAQGQNPEERQICE